MARKFFCKIFLGNFLENFEAKLPLAKTSLCPYTDYAGGVWDCRGTGVTMASKTPIKKFQDLNLSDAYLFAATLEDAETCRITLEILLGIKVDSVTVHAEHTVLFSRDYRSIRLDIYAQDESYNSYNVEMQVENEGNLPKRSRYHQAEMDVMSIPPGSSFNDLKPNYVVFICCFDPFGDGLFRYTFTNKCSETGAEQASKKTGDGSKSICDLKNFCKKNTKKDFRPDMMRDFKKGFRPDMTRGFKKGSKQCCFSHRNFWKTERLIKFLCFQTRIF